MEVIAAALEGMFATLGFVSWYVLVRVYKHHHPLTTIGFGMLIGMNLGLIGLAVLSGYP